MNEEKASQGSKAAGCAGGVSRRYGCLGALVGTFLLLVCVFEFGVGLHFVHLFISEEAIFIVLVVVGAGWLLAYGGRNTLRLLRVVCTKRAHNSEEARHAVAFCSCGIWVSLLAGPLGTVIGLIKMLSGGLSDPSLLTLGIAIALTTIFYGLLLALFFTVLRYRMTAVLTEWEERRKVYHAPRPGTPPSWGVIKRDVLLPLWLFLMGILALIVLSCVIPLVQNALR